MASVVPVPPVPLLHTTVRAALARNSIGIAYTYNEPTIWFEYVRDTATLARQAGLTRLDRREKLFRWL